MSNRLKTGYKMSHPDPGDEIVISGLSGYFPESNSVIELKENLFNKVDLVTDDDRRWSVFLTDIPRGLGKIDKLDKFDASFFGIDYKLGHNVDPMSRLLLERTYEAMIDAGMNPSEFRNTKTGVFVGCCFYESELNLRYNRINCNEHGVIGSAHSALAVRIAQWLGVTGPAYTVDTACSSSLYALEHAFKAIRSGACDSAIVCGSNLCLHPYVSVQFYRMGLLSPQGRCKSFDSSANGYARSEAVVVCLLQKNKDARRAYAQVVYAKMNCDGYKDNGITYPAGDLQKRLLKDFYEECDIPAKNVEYIEAHGTGTAVGDPEELNAIDDVLCKNREDPLFIGSIKSNLGHTEAASGLCATVKICIAYHTGFLPPNIHFHEARTGIPALAEGRLKVVTEKQAWNRGLACFSGFGFGGANAHALLKNFDKEKVNNGVPMDNLPRLVCVSGRTKSAVQRILTFLESKPVDAEEVRLWHAIHENKIEGHKFRGYSLLKSTLSSSEVLASDIAVFRDLSRPVYLVYPGVGLKSVGAKELMEIPTFAAAIHRCHTALKVHNVNLIDMITDPLSKDNVDIIISTVALQIGLTDIIKSVGIRPDGYVGYGIGELSCAYADGSLKADEAILIAYNYGLHESVKVAHRAEDLFSTVNSGHDVNKGNEINEETDVGTKLLKSMISELKPRLNLWLPRIGNKEIDKDSSVTAEYLYECLSHPLLSRDVIQIIPTNAISIQMTPGVDIQNILKKILKDGVQISLVKENTVNAQQDTLEALGRLFEAGLNLRVAELYPKVQFPVSQGTPMLSHLVEWDHREVWHTDSFKRSLKKLTTTERIVTISMADPDLEYLSGHVLGGRIIYPGTGYLVLVWETLAMMHKREYRQFSVVFENVRYHRATTIPEEGEIHFNIVIHPISGEFEVTEKNTTVVTGLIFPNTNVSKTMDRNSTLDNSDNLMELRLSHNDFYKDIKLRGYGHNGMFKGVLDCNISATHCRVAWVNNWIVYMDYVLQIFLLEKDTRNLYVPTEYPKITIDTELHYNVLAETNLDANQAYLDVFFDKHSRVVRSGGVEIRGFEATRVSKKADLNTPIFNTYDFVPNFGRDPVSFEDVVRCNVDIIIENLQVHKFKVLEILDEDSKIINNRSILAEVEKNVKDLPQVWPDLNVNYYNCMDIIDVFKEMSLHITEINKIPEDKSVVLLVGANLSRKAEILREYVSSLRDGGFILSREDDKSKIMNLAEKYDLITMYDTDFESIVLFKKKEKSEKKAFIRIESLDQQFSWIQKLKKSIEHDIKIVLYAHNEISGILGLVNCLRREPKGDMIQCVLITETSKESFDPEITFYKEQLDKNLAFNVFQNGCWGTYRHLNMKHRNIVSPMPHAFVNIETIGDLSTLKWFEGPYKTKDVKRHDDDSVFVHVYCAAVNFRDVMTAIGRVSVDAIARGRLEQEYVQGTEFAGRLSNGMRVIGMAPLSTANVVVCNKYRMMCVPDEWTLDEAATVLLAYSTVYLAFDVLGKMKPGESILIHAGTGGVGQAAINLALRRGCDVFTTVGTPEKRQYLKKLFPQLKESHIGNSRDTSFEQMVLTQTHGKGVDLVLNSLSDDKLLASIRCLGRRGRLLEIGKYDILMNTQIEMCCHEKEISFHGVMLDYVFDEIPLAKKLIELVTQGVAKGEVRPLTHCTFGKHEVETAYRYMASGKHIGKVIIKIRDEEKNVFAKPNALLIDAHRRYMCLPDSVYVLVGGLGGFGLELADWLVMRGAKKIVIVSSKGVSTGYQERKTRILTTYGVDVRIISDDVTTESGCKRVLEGAEAIGPVRAIFNLAGVLSDALFPQQTPEMFKRTFGPKALATLNLDRLSRHLCPEVQDFVVFSSLACGRGNAGQSNYGMANSVMERICEQRKRDGLPAVAIQWGAIGDVGMVAEMQAEYGEADVGGTMPQRISSCLQALDTLLFQPKPVVSSYVLAQKKDKANAKKTAVETIAQIIGIRNLKAVSYQASLADLGMDSMMALEIKQTLERDFEIVLSAQELRTLTFAKLITLAPGQEVAGQTKAEVKDDYTFDFRYFIRNFGEEENAFKPYIMMPSKHSLEADINKVTPTSRTLFMIPGLEGTSAFLEPLCRQINFNTCVLQLPLDKDTCTLEDIVQKLYKVVKPMLPLGSGFNLLGYSYGTLPVLELAAKLESDGHTGTVFCIDGSPAWIKALFKTRFGINDDVKLQDSVTKYVIESTLTNKDSVTNFIKNSASIANYDDRIDYIMSNSPETLKYSNDFIKTVCKVCMVRLKIVRDYDKEVVRKIKSRIVLIRPEVGIIRNFSQFYELDSFNENDVNVHYLKGNHWNILEDASCASIIEKHLSV